MASGLAAKLAAGRESRALLRCTARIRSLQQHMDTGMLQHHLPRRGLCPCLQGAWGTHGGRDGAIPVPGLLQVALS